MVEQLPHDPKFEDLNTGNAGSRRKLQKNSGKGTKIYKNV
jgi:hypothetical protein